VAFSGEIYVHREDSSGTSDECKHTNYGIYKVCCSFIC